jgi:hypothetical protein
MKNYFLAILLISIISCSSRNDDEIDGLCPEPFIIENAPQITKIDIYGYGELRTSYLIDENNRISEKKTFDVSYDNIVHSTKIEKYSYYSCGAIETISEYRETSPSILNNHSHFIYDEYGRLDREIIGLTSPVIVHFFEYSEDNKSVTISEYREYYIETGERDEFNHSFVMSFDNYENDNRYNFDSDYNIVSAGIQYHSLKNPFFIIANKTFGRKNLFFRYPSVITHPYGLVESGIVKSFIDEYIYPFGGTTNNFTIEESHEGYAKVFYVSNTRVEVTFK